MDVTLFDDLAGREVDMGSPFDYFGRRSHPGCTEGLSQQQIDNRLLLQHAMVRRGFVPLDTEWWHFRLENEPYPDTYFDVPVAAESAR